MEGDDRYVDGKPRYDGVVVGRLDRLAVEQQVGGVVVVDRDLDAPPLVRLADRFPRIRFRLQPITITTGKPVKYPIPLTPVRKAPRQPSGRAPLRRQPAAMTAAAS